MRLLIIASILASTSVFACPDLTGNFQACVDQDGNTSAGVELTQRVSNGVTIYTGTSLNEESGELETDEIIADGVLRTENIDGEIVTTKATCAGNKLKLENTYKAQWGESTATSTVEKVNNQLVMTTTASVQGQSFQVKSICK